MQVKTIDITALEWFDKVNGNSYFSATVTLDYGMPSQSIHYLPFQYGYGDHYRTEAAKLLHSLGVIQPENGGYLPGLTRWARENGVTLRTVKHENCKRAELANPADMRKRG